MGTKGPLEVRLGTKGPLGVREGPLWALKALYGYVKAL